MVYLCDRQSKPCLTEALQWNNKNMAHIIFKFHNYFVRFLSFSFIFFIFFHPHSIQSEIYFSETIYSSFTQENSILTEKLDSYKNAVSETSFNENKPFSNQDSDSSSINSASLESVYTSYSEESRNMVKSSSLENLKELEQSTQNSFNFEKLISSQTSIPITVENTENFFPAYNQQHTQKGGVQFAEVTASFNDQDLMQDQNKEEFKTFVNIETMNTNSELSFENIVRNSSSTGVNTMQLLDKINSVTFGPNLSDALNNTIPKTKDSKENYDFTSSTIIQKTQLLGAM